MSASDEPAPRLSELSPPGRGGLSVLILEGPGALEQVRELLPGARLDLGAPVVGRLRLDDERAGADEALVCALDERRVELHVHGSPALVRELRGRFGPARGAEPANDVEWARALLPRAPSEAGARILLDQLEGALRRELARVQVLPEAELERELQGLARRSRHARRAIEPARVLLAGPVNAGKSTLFNALVGAPRASVSDEPGTTRDALEELALLGAWPVRLIDSAGERSLGGAAPAATIERAAQGLARELARDADLVLWLRPPGGPAPAGLPAPTEVLASRGDLADAERAALRPREDPEAARERVGQRFRCALDLPADPWEPGRGVAVGPRARARLDALPSGPVDARRDALARWLEAERR